MGTYTIQQCQNALAAIQTAKANIATAITNKGGAVAASAVLADMPTAIGTIPSGSIVYTTIAAGDGWNGNTDSAHFKLAVTNVPAGKVNNYRTSGYWMPDSGSGATTSASFSRSTGWWAQNVIALDNNSTVTDIHIIPQSNGLSGFTNEMVDYAIQLTARDCDNLTGIYSDVPIVLPCTDDNTGSDCAIYNCPNLTHFPVIDLTRNTDNLTSLNGITDLLESDYCGIGQCNSESGVVYIGGIITDRNINLGDYTSLSLESIKDIIYNLITVSGVTRTLTLNSQYQLYMPTELTAIATAKNWQISYN